MKKLNKILLSLTVVLFSSLNTHCFGNNIAKPIIDKNAQRTRVKTKAKPSAKSKSKVKAKAKTRPKTKVEKKKLEPIQCTVHKLNDNETKVNIIMYIPHSDKNKNNMDKVEICDEQGKEISKFSKKVSKVTIDGKTYIKIEISYIVKIKENETGKFVWPVPGYYNITSGFNESAGREHVHGAIDIGGAGIYGCDVVASGSGKIIIASSEGWGGGYGKHVVIDHGNGKSTLYGHMSLVSVKPGQEISAGEKIGNVGNTGFSTGPHLHFEYRENGVRTNPAHILEMP